MIISFFLNLLLSDVPSALSTLTLKKEEIVSENQIVSFLPQSNFRGVVPPKKKFVEGRESLGIALTARSAIVIDVESGTPLFDKQFDVSASIASLTKLMTALVFLEHNPGWDKVITLEKRDERPGSSPRLYRGDEVLVRDLFYASLVSSDNNSTIALVRSTGYDEPAFVALMNQKARQWGLSNTMFLDPTGLNDGNVSTALDISRLIFHAMLSEDIRHATTRRSYNVSARNSNQVRKLYTTDRLLESYINNEYEIKGGKTGFTTEAGSCLGVMVGDKRGREIIVVVMGSQNNVQRFTEVKALTEWTFENYEWAHKLSQR